jgi:hypothetical protein
MGARTNFELKDSEGSVWLYSHWGGDTKENDLAAALDKARPRWGDVPYAMRIVVSQLIGDSWDSETGYGLSSYESCEENYSPITVDFDSARVIYEGNVYSFQEFIDQH